MANPYISHMHIKSYGCIKDASADLTRIHAFIGPNDSGKTTLLKAIQVSLQHVGVAFGFLPAPTSTPDPATRRLPVSSFRVSGNGEIGLQVDTGIPSGRRALLKSGTHVCSASAGGVVGSPAPFKKNPFWRSVTEARLLRMEPDEMRKPAQITGLDALTVVDEKGPRLAGVLDAIMNRNPRDFIELEAEFIKLFPTVKSLRLVVPGTGVKQLALTQNDGTEVPAEGMSEGMVYYLGLATLTYLQPTSLVLIEEPENGLHPARVKEVMQILRKLSETTQILLATHSPLVINELNDDEVTLVTRNETEGTRLTPIRKTRNFDERRQVYALGELWLSYADGNSEEALVDTTGAIGAVTP